ncbi:MAG: hypothetical protein AAF480_03385 [Actinomycetota bacterium]
MTDVADLRSCGDGSSRLPAHHEHRHGKEHPMMSIVTNQFVVLAGAAVATGAC